MKIKSADLERVAVNKDQYPEISLPEIAFAGRSNVGKSSLINNLLNRRSLARTSQTPGKTQTINFYIINQEVFFVDLPGYGFARVPKDIKKTWGKMVETYLSDRDNLQAVFLLLDIRHEPTKEDAEMYQWLKHFGVPTAIIATKADKIARGQWQKHTSVITKKIQKDPDDPLIIHSSSSGQGKDAILNLIDEITDYWKELKAAQEKEEANEEGNEELEGNESELEADTDENTSEDTVEDTAEGIDA
jgi:GTP-binding protein